MYCKVCRHGGMVRRKCFLKCEWCGSTIPYKEENHDDEVFVEINEFMEKI